MTMKPCKEGNREISQDAATVRKTKFRTWVIVTFVTLLIYVGIKKTSSVPLEPSVEVPMSITAKQFHRDYQANEARADEKYKGKLLTVTGNVASIDKDLWGILLYSLVLAICSMMLESNLPVEMNPGLPV